RPSGSMISRAVGIRISLAASSGFVSRGNPSPTRRGNVSDDLDLIVKCRRKQDAMPRAILALGLLTWAAVALSIDNGHVGVFHDDGVSLVSAQAIRDGRGYQLPSRPGNPPPKYPPGLPLAI